MLKTSNSGYLEEMWEIESEQLADFKDEFGHLNVPQNYTENKPLGTWVSTQTKQYKLFEASKTSNMTRERIQFLEELGFEWEVRSYNWEELRQQLFE